MENKVLLTWGLEFVCIFTALGIFKLILHWFWENFNRSGGGRNHVRVAGLSDAEIENLPRITICEAQIRNGEECTVCLDLYQEGDECRMLPKCQHTFHKECISAWLSKRASCPICRQTVQDSIAQQQQQQQQISHDDIP